MEGDGELISSAVFRNGSKLLQDPQFFSKFITIADLLPSSRE